MTNSEAFYIIGNIPIPIDDENYDICQYQEAKAIALDCIDKVDKINEVLRELEDKQEELDTNIFAVEDDDWHGQYNNGVIEGIDIAIDLIKDKLGVSK